MTGPGAILLIVFALLLVPYALAQGPDKLPPEFKNQVELLSSAPMFLAAESLGITSVAGKDITTAGSPPGNANSKKLIDVGIGITPAHENEPSVAANPRDKKNLVAASHRFPAPGGVGCVAYTSGDNGQTWSAGVLLPQLGTGQCSDPVVAYAPNGSRVYAAYMNIIGSANWDIVVSHSDDNGATWSTPVIALDGIPGAGGFVYDKPWLETHVDAGESSWVYVTATKFNFSAPPQIAFARSNNQGASFVGPTIIDAALSGQVVQGSRPRGGLGGQVMVAWYHSGTDGWLAGGFQIRTRSSSDHGATWGPIVTAAADSYELPFWLGPGQFYHRWWGGMFPDLEIDSKGNAHIAYTHSPCNQATPACFFGTESGDIRYVTNESGVWSPPVTVSDDTTGRAQGYAALRVGNGDQLHLAWEDHRLSPQVPTAFPNSSNLMYDAFYSRKPKGTGWFSNFRVSDVSSISDFIFIGDYTDLADNNTTLFHVFTDRRHQTSIFAPEDNVFGTRIKAGGGAP